MRDEEIKTQYKEDFGTFFCAVCRTHHPATKRSFIHAVCHPAALTMINVAEDGDSSILEVVCDRCDSVVAKIAVEHIDSEGWWNVRATVLEGKLTIIDANSNDVAGPFDILPNPNPDTPIEAQLGWKVMEDVHVSSDNEARGRVANIGDRVIVLESMTKDEIVVIGRGVYAEDVEVTEGPMYEVSQKLPPGIIDLHTPKIVLDSGEACYGYEVWFAPEDLYERMAAGKTVVNRTLEELRGGKA